MFTARDGAWVLVAAATGAGAGMVLAIAAPELSRLSLGENPAWYAARASGMVAYLLATASVLLGMATSMRLGERLLGKANVADLHRSLSLLTLIAISAHLLFLALDGYAKFTIAQLSIPFVSWYRPFWTGFGIISAYLAFAVYASFYLRRWISYKAWRAFHYATFGVWGLGTLHGIGAGTDTSEPWVIGIYITSVLLVIFAAVYRFTGRVRVPHPARRIAMVGVTAVPSPLGIPSVEQADRS